VIACEHVTLPGGGRAIVCGTRRRQRCSCGRPATLACDWKVPTRRSGTCDAPICAACTTSPEPGKDLCLTHAVAFERWKASRTQTPKTTEAAAQSGAAASLPDERQPQAQGDRT
jgi:hypothetical protein